METGFIEAHPREQHALDSIVARPQLDLVEVENVGDLVVVVVSSSPGMAPSNALANHSARQQALEVEISPII